MKFRFPVYSVFGTVLLLAGAYLLYYAWSVDSYRPLADTIASGRIISNPERCPRKSDIERDDVMVARAKTDDGHVCWAFWRSEELPNVAKGMKVKLVSPTMAQGTDYPGVQFAASEIIN
jgi:hypothetical protein